MSIKIGINGFGRIGRMVMRAALNHPQIEIVGINDLCPADYLAYMLKYDTMHGKFGGDVSSAENAIIINGKSIPVFAERNPADLPWGELGAEYVVESTGLFLTKEKAQAPHRRRRQARRHVCPLQGRHPHVRHGREPGQVHLRHAVRVQRVLHDELPGPHRKGAE